MRLDKFLAHSLICTRGEATAMIKKSKVTVNGVIAQKGDLKINENNDFITVNGKGKRRYFHCWMKSI